MTKILETHKPLIYKIKKCRHCKIKFAYCDDDIISGCFSFNNYDRFVECPVCGHENKPSIFDRKYKGDI